MATVIERLVIQGCNPLRAPHSVRRSPRPNRKRHTPAATPIGLTPVTCAVVARQSAVRSLPADLLTISGQRAPTPSATHAAVPTANVPVDAAGALTESSTPEAATGRTPADPMPSSAATTPIVRKMEYLALVRQARQGMTIMDAGSTSQRPAAARDKFVIEGRTMGNRSPTVSSCQTSVSSRRGYKKTRFTAHDPAPDSHTYSDSDVSSISDRPDGHVDNFRLFRQPHRRGASSIRSVCSDSSFRSPQLPTLTRGSSEPGGFGGAGGWRRSRGRQTADSDISMSENAELTAMADHLLLARQRRTSTAPDKHQHHPRSPAPSTTLTKTTPRPVSHAAELRACLNVAAQPTSSSNGDVTRTMSPRHQQKNPGSSSEGALLYKRHKLMEKIAKGTPGKAKVKYTFTSVSSYLNYNRIVTGTPSGPPPQPAQQAGFRKTTPRAPGPTPDLSPRKMADAAVPVVVPVVLSEGPASLKRSSTYKHNATVITDLDEYFMIKTPRFDHKPKPSSMGGNAMLIRRGSDGVSGNYLSEVAGRPPPPPPLAPQAPMEMLPAAGKPDQRQSVVKDEKAESPKAVTSVVGPHASTVTVHVQKTKTQRVVSVPSADSEHWTGVVTS